MAATDDTTATNEDTPVITNVLVNDRDPNGRVPQLDGIASNPANGTAAIDAGQGTITYTPEQDFSGEDSLVYRVVDSAGTRSTATLTVAVRPLNDPPVATNGQVSTPEDTPITFDPRLNDVDADGDPLRITSVDGAANGRVRIGSEGITYTPNQDFSGSEVLSYTVSDGNGGVSSALIDLQVTPVNDPPVAGADRAETDEDTPVDIEVLANDTDVDGDTLTVGRITAGPANGTATINADGTVAYTPNEDFNGTDSFDYQAADGNGGTDTATVTVRVNPVNDTPVAADDTAAVVEDAKASTLDVLANDIDGDGDRLRVVAVGDEATLGTVAIAKKGGGVTYTPNPDANGTDTFTYTVADPSGETSTATVTVEITPVNDAPVTEADEITTDEDAPVSFDPLANDSDADGDELTIVEVGEARSGAVTIDPGGRTLTYTPNPDANGGDRFTYTVTDGELTATATVTVTVEPVNDEPVATDDAATTAEDRAVRVNVLANDTDLDGDRLTVDAIVTGPANGTAEISDNQILYTPDLDFNGNDTLVYRVADGNGGVAEATVALEVTAVNDAPVAVDDEVDTDEDSALVIDALANDTDVDGNALSITSVGGAKLGTATLAEDGQSITYTPNPDANGVDTINYTTSDGELRANATIAVTVNPVNDAPVAEGDEARTAEDTAVLIEVLRNDSDVDGDELTVGRIVDQPANGTAAIDPETGRILYTPNEDFNGEESIVYEVTDGDLSDTATVVVTVTPVNDPPVAVDDAVATEEDAPVAIDLVANDTDVDGDALRVASVGRPTSGTAAIDRETGEVRYTPSPDFSGSDSFTYVVNDDQGGTATGTVTVEVAPVNDDPVAEDDSATTGEESATLIDVLANDTDVDNDALQVQSVGTPANGTTDVDPGTGQIRYTPNEDFNGDDSFTYVVADAEGGSDTATVSVTVSPENDPPVAEDDAVSTLEDTAGRFDVVANDTDPDGDALRLVEVGEASNGTTSIDGNQLVYTPDADFSGSDSFTYVVSDRDGLTDAATVTVEVAPVNDAPVAADDSFEVAAGSTGNILDILSNDSDIDSNLNPRSVQVTSAPSNGLLAVRGNGEVAYQPLDGFTGTDSFSYTVADAQGLASNTARATISVQAQQTASEPAPILPEDVLDDNGIDGGGVATDGTSVPASMPDVETLVSSGEAVV